MDAWVELESGIMTRPLALPCRALESIGPGTEGTVPGPMKPDGVGIRGRSPPLHPVLDQNSMAPRSKAEPVFTRGMAPKVGAAVVKVVAGWYSTG